MRCCSEYLRGRVEDLNPRCRLSSGRDLNKPLTIVGLWFRSKALYSDPSFSTVQGNLMPDPSLVLLPSGRGRGAIPIIPVSQKSWPKIERALDKPARTWLAATGFAGAAGKHALVPDRDGRLERVF